MRGVKVLGERLELERRRRQAKLGKVPAPRAVTSELHGIEFQPGERVFDTVTGQEVEVVGGTIIQYERESAGA